MNYMGEWWRTDLCNSLEPAGEEEMQSGVQYLLPWSCSNKKSEKPEKNAVKRYSQPKKQEKAKVVPLSKSEQFILN